MEAFERLKAPDEELVAPRPLPGRVQPSYFALLRLRIGSDCYKFFEQNKNCLFIQKPEYEKQKSSLTYTWVI